MRNSSFNGPFTNYARTWGGDDRTETNDRTTTSSAFLLNMKAEEEHQRAWEQLHIKAEGKRRYRDIWEVIEWSRAERAEIFYDFLFSKYFWLLSAPLGPFISRPCLEYMHLNETKPNQRTVSTQFVNVPLTNFVNFLIRPRRPVTFITDIS